MSDQWFYSSDGRQTGPVGLDGLRQLALTGQLKPDDMVWCEGMPAWIEARSVDGLFGAAQVVSQPRSPSGTATRGPKARSVRLENPAMQPIPTVQKTDKSASTKMFFRLSLMFGIPGLLILWLAVLGTINAPSSKSQNNQPAGDATTSDNQDDANQDGSTQDDSTASTEAPPIQVSATEVARAYESNEVTADIKYKNKPLLVTGTVFSVSKSNLFENSISATLSDNSDFPSDDVVADHLSETDAVKLSKGMRVTFLCTGNGNPSGMQPNLDNCVLQH